MDSKTRLRKLADSANVRIEPNIPIRRYYRSGNEILKMAKVYDDEGNMEAAYVLYLKYVSLFLEGIKQHKDYAMVLPAEKKKTNATLKLVLSISEAMKNKLKKRFDVEYEEWLVQEEERKKILEQERKRLEEERKKREEEEAKRAALIAKDHQLAIWTQAQIDRGLDPDAPPPPRDDPSSKPSAPKRVDLPPEYNQVVDTSSHNDTGAQLPSYSSIAINEIANDLSALHLPSNETSYLPPNFDRSSKPVAGPSSDTKSDIPFIPDRSMKPVFGNDQGRRSVMIPGKLITNFLSLAKQNSDRNVETLGMLGGKLSKNKFTVTHLLIPKQTGQSDRCDLQGHEELGDTYDNEDIILVGWIHTHPAYDVFLSSVDMHNQYEYQNMLDEFVAVVCSIKFNETGYLSLTEEGMQEIGKCSQTNFHPHSKTPALFKTASHVIHDDTLNIKVMDLR